MNMKVNILVLNYNCWFDTLECVNSILENDYQDFHIYLMDNCSSDDSKNQLEKNLHNIKNTTSQIQNATRTEYYINGQNKITFDAFPENHGFAGANNIIISELISKNEFIWLLNPDMIIQKDTLSCLINCAKLDDQFVVWGIITNDYLNRGVSTIVGGAKINPFLGTVSMQSSDLDYINGNALFCKTDVFKKYGLLNSEYFLYWEESDWGYSIKKQGGKLKVCKSSVAFDKGGTSIGRGFMADYYYTRNGLYFVKKHFSLLHLFTSIVFSFARIMNRLINGQFVRAKGVLYGLGAFLIGKKGKIEN